MDLFTPIDIYCERVSAAYWAEPFNAVSNVAFIIAAIYGWKAMKARGGSDWPERIVILLAGIVGIGSFQFHSFANGWSELADLIPIWTFVAAYVLLAIYRASDENVSRTITTTLFIVAAVGLSLWLKPSADPTAIATPPPLNGSLLYVPAVVCLVFFTVLSFMKGMATRFYMLGATAVFLISLTFRTVDMMTCTSTIIGTHFIWHTLNGVMIGLLLLSLVKHMPPKAMKVAG